MKRSVECFSLAIENAPNWASAYNNRAQALRLSGDNDGNFRTKKRKFLIFAINFINSARDFKQQTIHHTMLGLH